MTTNGLEGAEGSAPRHPQPVFDTASNSAPPHPPPVFDTDRLVLRGWQPTDVDFVFDLYSRWEVQRYIGLVPRVMDAPAEAAERLERLLQFDHPVHGHWAVALKDSGALVGTILLKSIPASGELPLEPSGDTEIGWHFHPDAWGHGYATEAAAVVLRHGLASKLSSIVAVTAPANIPSQNVCLRIGMSPRGLTSRYYNATCELFVSAP